MTITIKSIVRTCAASPSQWEGFTVDDRPIYIRYRWGELSVRLGPVGGTIRDALDTRPMIDITAGEKLGGIIDLEEACEAAGLELLDGAVAPRS